MNAFDEYRYYNILDSNYVYSNSFSLFQPSSMPPAVALTRSEASTASPGGDLRQPPNSPSAHRPAAPGAAVPVLGTDQGIKPLIDLTEGKEKEDLELQKAIKLSLQVS